MSATPVGQGYTEPNSAYYLDQLRRYIAQNKAGKTSSNAYTPSYGLPILDSLTVTDAIATSSDAIGTFDVLDDSANQKLWLSFDSDVIDKSGNADDGTVSGTTTFVTDSNRYFDARYTKVFSFNGSSQINIANENTFDRTNIQEMSISFWAKWTTASAMVFVTKMTAAANQGYEIGCLSTGEIKIRLINTATTNEINKVTTTTYNTGTWRHFVLTKSTSSDTVGVKLYVDGVSVSLTTTTNNLSATLANAIAVSVGGYNGGTSRFTGSMDDVQWWNVELTAAEVTKMAQNRQISRNAVVLQPVFLNFADWAA